MVLAKPEGAAKHLTHFLAKYPALIASHDVWNAYDYDTHELDSGEELVYARFCNAGFSLAFFCPVKNDL